MTPIRALLFVRGEDRVDAIGRRLLELTHTRLEVPNPLLRRFFRGALDLCLRFGSRYSGRTLGSNGDYGCLGISLGAQCQRFPLLRGAGALLCIGRATLGSVDERRRFGHHLLAILRLRQ
jgi:hypothetical protein